MTTNLARRLLDEVGWEDESSNIQIKKNLIRRTVGDDSTLLETLNFPVEFLLVTLNFLLRILPRIKVPSNTFVGNCFLKILGIAGNSPAEIS